MTDTTSLAEIRKTPMMIELNRQMVSQRRSLSVVTAAMVLIGSTAQARTPSPFSGFDGRWIGDGSVAMTDGSREAIRCEANYASQQRGASLQVRIDCASDSFKFQVASSVAADAAGAITGTWQEATRQVEGDVTGRVPRPGQIQASLGGTPYGIQFSVNTRGNLPALALQSQGTDMRSPTVNLRRR